MGPGPSPNPAVEPDSVPGDMNDHVEPSRRDDRRVFIPAPTGTAPAKPAAPAKPRPAPAKSAAARPPATPRGAPTRKRWPIVLLGITLSLVLLMAGGLLWANWKFGQIERVQVSSVLGGGSGTNYLFVGSDSREGTDPNDPTAGALVPVSGQRSDTLLILRTSGDSGSMLSIPRDLFVTIADTGEQQRINAAYNGGPERLVKTIRNNLGIPIHRYVEVDFVSFAGLVDAVGGITIDFPHPARDPKSGLLVTSAGPQVLDGSQALAFVRSRTYIETVDGVERTDPTADLGRVQRQQQFLRAVLDKVGATRNPFKLVGIANSLVDGLRIDDEMTLFDALGLLRQMSSLDPQPQTLPTTPFVTSGGAQVLDLVDEEAEPILQQFR